ncbi:hypothetical protein [Listeria aquatica]|uniref:hypothetical protein n=1 Tax=Listeria aquatica TaxID=1494960 RepID=UPI0031F5D183
MVKDVHYQEDDFEKAEKSIGNLIGKGVWGKGAIDSLKDVSKNLEEVEKILRDGMQMAPFHFHIRIIKANIKVCSRILKFYMTLQEKRGTL